MTKTITVGLGDRAYDIHVVHAQAALDKAKSPETATS